MLPKQTRKILSYFNNLFSFAKPNKRRVVFFVLAAVVLIFSVHCLAAPVSYTEDEKFILKTTYELTDSQITNLANKNVTYSDFTSKAIALQEGSSTYTPSSAANTVYNEEMSSGDVTSDSLNQFSGKAALGGLWDALSEIVLAVVIGVLSVIAAFCKSFVEFGAQVLDFTLNPSLYSFTNNDLIKQGWVVVRDVCNLFFLLALVFIAICTILKIEKYHAKKTLLMLIIMALLINFSKPIAIFIFDGSQLLMTFFLNQMGRTGTGQSTSTIVAKATQIADLVYKSLPGYWGSSQTSLNIAVQYLFAVVFLFMLAMAFVVTALFLIIRIVAIMLLIVVSPLAFFAAIIPDFSKMGSSWWNAIFKYSYYGPAAAFFLLLATRLENSLPHLTTSINTGTSAGNLNTTVTNIMYYLTVLVFLYASIIMSQQFGIFAAGAITGNANRFMKWAGGMTKGGGMWGGAARVTGAADVYKGVKGGIAQRKYWRALTKEGREAASKEREERWKGKVAPFSMAVARKQADDRKNDDQKKVDAGVAKGNAADILIASKRGTLTDAQLENIAVQNIISRNPELRKEVLSNVRDKGQTHLAAYTRFLTREQESDVDNRSWSLSQFGEKEINDNKKLADMDWEKATSFQEGAFRGLLVNRLNNMANTNPQGFLNTVSNFDGTKMNFILNNPDFSEVVTRAQESARGGRDRGGNEKRGQPAEEPRVETARDYRPRERTVYDNQGRPVA